MAQKRRKTGITKCEDEYAVSQHRQALSAKANTGKFLGLRAKKPAKPNSAKITKHSGKDFVYGVLFVTLVAFCAKKPLTVQRNGSFPRKMVDMKKMFARVWSH